ncbi:MAG: methyltransferase domain-containing protein [Gammaproteobacteria bacterium]|nr:methyltransferase domain-containing protein [Gammaproteobacteria bacterium]NNJ93111.1 methyltransferase domain-containing protein [Gammaproteobacteria bacterium]
MAVVWQQEKQGVLYQVRSAGKTLRLYTDGVLHSQYNPGQPVTGHAWDWLMLPAFFYPEDSIRRVLVLGVGGGTVIHQLNHFIQPEEIVGVEMCKTHLSLGKRFFGLKKKNIKLLNADAFAWLNRYQGEPFDMIIDDVFSEADGEPLAVSSADNSWFQLMLRHLDREGVIVKNFIDRKSLRESMLLTKKPGRKRFKSIYQFDNPFNENVVIACSRARLNSRYFRKRLIETPGLKPQQKTSRLRYRLRTL